MAFVHVGRRVSGRATRLTRLTAREARPRRRGGDLVRSGAPDMSGISRQSEKPRGIPDSILKSGRYSGNVSRGFPGEVEQSFSPPCVCVRNHCVRAAPLLPRPLRVARLCVFQHLYQLLEGRITDLSCLCVVRHRPCSQLSCKLVDHCSMRFQN